MLTASLCLCEPGQQMLNQNMAQMQTNSKNKRRQKEAQCSNVQGMLTFQWPSPPPLSGLSMFLYYQWPVWSAGGNPYHIAWLVSPKLCTVMAQPHHYPAISYARHIAKHVKRGPHCLVWSQTSRPTVYRRSTSHMTVALAESCCDWKQEGLTHGSGPCMKRVQPLASKATGHSGKLPLT